MARGDSSAVLRHVRALFGAGAAGGMSDGQLLERFRRRGGDPDAEAAFAVLVARHGPMVFGVCRRALRDPNDAADAFQATFLILVRKAGSVRVDDSLGRWLYGVSRRVATRAKAARARRAAREGRDLGREQAGPEPESVDEAERQELHAALDEEVARLPEPFRATVVLCDLAGLPHDAAAQQFGCPVGTVESRLSRGRKRLREQLARRGLAPMVAGSAGLAPPVVPEALSVSTVEAAARAGSVSVAVSTLIEGVITDMAWKTFKTLALGLAAVTIACGLGITAAHRLRAEDHPPESRALPAAAPDEPDDAAANQPQPGDRDWVGQLVITRLGTVLKVGPQVVDDQTQEMRSRGGQRHVRFYRVEQTSGPWLWLAPEDGGVNGWVPVAQVVPLDQVIDYFTGLIRANPKSGSAYFFRGCLWFGKNEYDKVIADDTEAIRLDPKDAQAYNDRGYAWNAKGEHDKAIADCTEAIRLDPRWSGAYENRGNAWRAKGEIDKAIVDLTEAIRLDPGGASLYLSRGDAWTDKHEDDKAVADFTEAIRIDPGNAGVYNNRGTSWIGKEEYDKAIADFTEAIRINPEDAMAYRNRGTTWTIKREYDKAIADCTEAIRLDPGTAWTYNTRGDAWNSKGEYEEALADYTEAIRLDPTDALAYLNPKDAQTYGIRGFAWSEKREYDKAIADFTEAIRLDPRDGSAYLGRGNAWSEKREYDTAIADFTEAIRLDPKHAPYINRGFAWSANREYVKAIADFTEAIRIDPKDACGYNHCAWIWATCPDARHRDGRRAVESATRACALSEEKVPYQLETLAAAYAESGDFDLAVKWQERVVGMYKDEGNLLKEATARLALYQAKKPYHQDPAAR